MSNRLDRLAWSLAGIFAVDRLLKFGALAHFCAQLAPPAPEEWPQVALIQPITRGVRDLTGNLRARLQMEYPAPVAHLWVCDAADTASQAICVKVQADFPAADIQIIAVETPGAVVAPKIRKLQTALPFVKGTVIGFMDDDVAPRPDTLRGMIPYLNAPRTGAVFGLPCFTNWRNPWSSLLSGFVNANMPLSFVSLIYLTEPFRLTGHISMFPRTVFDAVGGLDGLETQIDDDFELARRLREYGWRAVQTPVVYDIDNDLPTAGAYHRLLTRWFVLPGQSMLPQLSPWQKTVATLSSGPALVIPGLLALLGIGSRRRSAWLAFGATLALFGGVYAATERRYLGKRTPLYGWLWLPVAACVTPLHALSALIGRKQVEWRGQTLAIARDGRFEVVECDK